MMPLAFLVLVGFSSCFLLLWKWNNLIYSKKRLPPGTMKWPVFGETMEFLKYGPDFMKKQKARYGSFFKTHILGSPTIVCMDPELNRYILMSEWKGLVPGYSQSMLDILGKNNIAAVDGSSHKIIRRSLMSLVGPNIIKDHILRIIDKPMQSFLENWDGRVIDMQQKTKEMAYFIAIKQMLEVESKSREIYEIFMKEFDKLVVGVISLPINFPGTNYHYGHQARKKIVKMLRQIMTERRASLTTQDDILGHLLRGYDAKFSLSDEEIIDIIITIWYSGYETVSTTTMMALKYLNENPKALHKIREEHFAIRDRKKFGEPINWDDFKSMIFTRAVIFETSRLATVVNGVLRKTTKDVELNGFVVPKGWRIYVYTREINYDPILYPEPLSFNPWRWMDNGMESHNYCFLFGGGTRECPGKELGIAKIAVFLHYFLTKYSWEVIGGEILKFPRVIAPNGLHIRVSKFEGKM